MDDMSSKEITDLSTQQIKELISKVQILLNFNGFNISIFEQIRKEFVQLPSHIVKEASLHVTSYVMAITIDFIRKFYDQPENPDKILYLRNLLSLLSLMGFKASRMNFQTIDDIFSTFSSFIRKCDRSLLPIILHVFYHILDDVENESDQVRQKFLKFFIPSFTFCIKSFIPIFSTSMNLPETTFFMQVIEFLLKLTKITYTEIQYEVDQLLSTLYQFLEVSPKNYSSIHNLNNVLLIQSQIIKIFITYNQLKLPIQNFKIEMVVPNLLNILKYVNPSYYYNIRDILLNLILIMKCHPQNTQNFSNLLANLPLFCQFSRYNINVIDPYSILITNLYEKSFNLGLINDQTKVHLFFYMMNILHYQGVPSFIRHNEFVQLQQNIPIKGYILFLYNYSFDIDFIKSIRSLSKYYLIKFDIDSLLSSYDKTLNIGKSIMKIFRILASNLKIIYERYRSMISSLLCEVTSKYSICNTKYFISTVCNAMFFIMHFHRLTNHLSTIIPEVSKTTTIDDFYEIERKMINISTIAENTEKNYNLLLNELMSIFSIIPMNFVCNILDIFFKKLFDQKELSLEKSFISAFCQKSSTLVPFVDSYFSFIIPQFQSYKNVKTLFSVTLFVFQTFNEVEIEYRVSTQYQQLLHNHALRLIYILKEDYSVSINHFSDFLKLISNVILFIDKFVGNSQFSTNLINNNNFIRDICKSFQCISILPEDSIEFIDFCSSISDKALILPYVIDVLISTLEKYPELSITLLNKATKISKKAVYQHPMSSLLFQSSAYLLNRIENLEYKKILLKFLKHSTPNAITNIGRIPDDLLTLKKFVFQNISEKVEFFIQLPHFINKLEETMRRSPSNEMLYTIIADTILSIFATKDLSFENRKVAMSLLSFLFSFYEKEKDLVNKCFDQILRQSESNYIVYAHIFVALCSNFQTAPTNFIISIMSIINTLEDFGTFVSEILVISYFNLLPSKSVMKLIITNIIQSVQTDLIDPISLALLGYEYLSSNSVSFGTKNEFKTDNLTTFSELGYLQQDQIEIIIFIRDLLSKSSSSLAPILDLIPTLSVFPQIILFEFMSRCKCTKEVLSFFDKCIKDKIQLDGALQGRLVGLTLRAFPDIISLKSDQILELLSTLETSYLSSSSSNSSSSPPSLNSCSPSSSMNSLPSFFPSSSTTTFSSGSIERQQEGNILLILNILLSTNPSLVTNCANYFSSVVHFLSSNNLFYRHQARIGIKNFYEIKNNEIDLMINIAHKEYMHSINFPEDIYESTFIDFSTCYEYLMIFFPIYHSTIFSTIIKYLKHIENSFVVNRDENCLKKPEKHKINQDIFIRSLLSLLSFFSNGSVIKILVDEGYMIKLIPYISFVYCTFIFQRNRIFDDYVLKMLEQAPKQFVEYINTSSNHPHCLDFFVIFLENEKALEIMKKYENEIKLNLNLNPDQKVNNYNLSVTTILIYFGKDVEKSQQCLMNYIDSFRSDIRHEPYLFTKIMSNLASDWPKLFLLILFYIIKADSPLLLSHCKIIFIDNIQSFDLNIFDDLPYGQYSELVNESFFNNIISHYILNRPDSLKYFIDLVRKTQTSYVISSFFLVLNKKKIISQENCDVVDALELFDKCNSDRGRLKTLLYWSKFPKCSNFSKMFTNLESFISLYLPSEVYDCLRSLSLPKSFKLPSSYFDIIPFFYNQESTYSAVLTLISRNYNDFKSIPEYLMQDLLMNLEFSFDSANSRITDSLSLFEEVFSMIKTKEDETLIRRCEGYISKTISIVKVFPSSSRTFLKLMLSNAFKIIKLYKDENENENEESVDESEEFAENARNRLLLEDITTFFNYMLENQRNTPAIPALACFLPDLTDLLVENDEESSAENLLSQIVDLDNQPFWPYVMKALNIISAFDSIYERIVEFRSTSLIYHSLPIIWQSQKEKTSKQVDITIDFCSLKPKSRVEILLQNICMIYMTRNLQQSISLYLIKKIFANVKLIDIDDINSIDAEKSKEVICKVLEFGIKSENKFFVEKLLTLFDNKKITTIFFNKNKDKINDELLSQLSPIALLNGCNFYMNKYPLYIEKVFSELPHNYYVKLSELFAPIFYAKPTEAIELMTEIGLKLKMRPIKFNKNEEEEEPQVSLLNEDNETKTTEEEENNNNNDEGKRSEEEEEKENNKNNNDDNDTIDDDDEKTKSQKDENESDNESQEDEIGSQKDEKESQKIVIQKINFDYNEFFKDSVNFDFNSDSVLLKSSFDCLDNLSSWEFSNLKTEKGFENSFDPNLSSFQLYSHLSLKEEAQLSIIDIIEDPDVSLSQVSAILNEQNYDSLLNFIVENITEPDVVLTELTNFLDKMQEILDDQNFIDYLIIHTLKCPIEMISKGSTTFPPHAFELKLSPSILPKYHNLYSKVRDSFLIAFSKYKRAAKNMTDKSGVQSESVIEMKSLQSLNNKFKSIHEKHKLSENLSIANFEGNEEDFNTPEKDIERLVTAVFSSSLRNESIRVIDATIATLEKGLKLNPTNDVFLTILATKYDEIDLDRFENLLNFVKAVPLKWSPIFIDLIENNENAYNEENKGDSDNENEEEEEESEAPFMNLLPKIHRSYYISLVEKDIDVPDDTKKLVNCYLKPLHKAIKSFKCKDMLFKAQTEKEMLRFLRRKNYNKRSIPNDIKSVMENYCEKIKERQNENEKKEDENENEEEDDDNNNNEKSNLSSKSSSFFISTHLPSVPPPLVDDSSSAIYMACYLKKRDDKFLTVTMSLNNGCSVNYMLAPFKVNQTFSLVCSLLSKMLKFDQQCCLQSQIIESMMSVSIGKDFTLIYANDAEPLYHQFLIRELYEGGIKAVESQDINKPKSRKQSEEVLIPSRENDFFYNFSKKENLIKWFYHFGSRYSAISLIQSTLDIPTPGPSEVFINPKTASTMFSTIDVDRSTNNIKFSYVRMCGKMRKFCSKFVLNGPFKDGMVSAATCFVVNQFKTNLFLNSLLALKKKDPFSFIKRCSYYSFHHSDPQTIQDNVNVLIEKSYNDQKIFVVPWL